MEGHSDIKMINGVDSGVEGNSQLKSISNTYKLCTLRTLPNKQIQILIDRELTVRKS